MNLHRLAIAVVAAFGLFIASESQGQTLTQSGPCPGFKTFTVTGAVPLSRLAFLYSTNTGSWVIPPGFPCGGTVTLLGPPVNFGGWVTANGAGVGTVTVWLPAGWCGTRYIQVVDTLSCTTTNMILVS